MFPLYAGHDAVQRPLTPGTGIVSFQLRIPSATVARDIRPVYRRASGHVRVGDRNL
jgi:hypothetical protein